jgi:hypothetical protein
VEKEVFVLPHPKGGTISSPRDNFDEKVPMSFEGILIGSEQLGYPGTVTERYLTLLQASIGIKNIQEQGRGTLPPVGPAKDFEGLQESPTIGMKLRGREIKVVQNLNLKV